MDVQLILYKNVVQFISHPSTFYLTRKKRETSSIKRTQSIHKNIQMPLLKIFNHFESVSGWQFFLCCITVFFMLRNFMVNISKKCINFGFGNQQFLRWKKHKKFHIRFATIKFVKVKKSNKFADLQIFLSIYSNVLCVIKKEFGTISSNWLQKRFGTYRLYSLPYHSIKSQTFTIKT